jgi:hypothetical protein
MDLWLEKQLEEVEKEGADKGREIASQDDFMTVYIDVSLPIIAAALIIFMLQLHENNPMPLGRRHRPNGLPEIHAS